MEKSQSLQVAMCWSITNVIVILRAFTKIVNRKLVHNKKYCIIRYCSNVCNLYVLHGNDFKITKQFISHNHFLIVLNGATNKY